MRSSWPSREIRRSILALAVGIVVGAGGVHGLNAQTQTVKRTDLIRADLTGVPGKEVYVTVIEAQPGHEFVPHFHYGDEFGFVIEGTVDGFLEQTQNVTKTGEAFHAPREKVHGGKVTSTTPAKMLVVHVVDKGKPLAERVKK
jgi:quercetin dioxygenase-like cupin family protein